MYLFSERGGGREKERERNINLLPLARLQWGTWPTTQACALTRSQTGDLLGYVVGGRDRTSCHLCESGGWMVALHAMIGMMRP